MTAKRTSYSKKNTSRFIEYIKELMTQVQAKNPQGLFLSAGDFGISVNTLHNRLCEALLWLRQNTYDNTYTPDDYEMLRARLKFQKEVAGVRILVFSGPNLSVARRSEGGNKEFAQQPADWKAGIEDYLKANFNDVESSKVFQNCLLTAEGIAWLDKIKASLNDSFEYHCQGDTLLIIRKS